MNTTPPTSLTPTDEERSNYEALQAFGLMAIAAGCLLAVCVVGLFLAPWLVRSSSHADWHVRVLLCGAAALLLIVVGVAAKSYGNRANLRAHARSRATSAHTASTLVVARACSACGTLNGVDNVECDRCRAAL